VIALVDYGAGNLTSVRKAFHALGLDIAMPAAPADLDNARGIVVPGVGHFGATAALDPGWRDAIRARIDAGVPFLGICLGLQWLFEGSMEAPDIPGLGVFPGMCQRLSEDGGLKIPHVGWNNLRIPRSSAILANITDGAQVYFTHSYAAPVVDATAAVTTYGASFSAVVARSNVSGVQFHPEKSGNVGLQVLATWALGHGA
jgi:imidazole glycerol-phosphate synthase subunit HisH